MANRGSFGVGPQGPTGQSTGAAGGDLGGNYPNPTIVDTANVETVVRLNRLDQMAVPTAAVAMNSQKLTGLANGTAATDAAAFGQVPTALPPNGAATGDLTGTYPAPTLAATAHVNTVVRANRLDQMAVPTADVNVNNNKIINLSNGTAIGDAANFGQIPTTLPPNGAASGDLSGTYPAPTVSKVNGISASGTPAYGQVLVANSSSAATWQILPGFMASTGVLSGGNFTINGTNPAAFDLVQTVGYICDYTTNPAAPIVTKVTIPAQTVVISGANLNNAINWWVSDASGVITSVGPGHPNEAQRRTSIQIGATASVVGTGQIVTVAPAPSQQTQPFNQLLDFMYDLGPFSVSGNAISANGANLTFNKAVGVANFVSFNAAASPNDPNSPTLPAETPVQFRYSTQLSGSEVGSLITALDPGHYDVNGTITAIGGGATSSTIQRVWFFTGGAGKQTLVQYGQTVYASLSAAVSAIGTTDYVTNPDFNGVGFLAGWIVMTRVATSLNDPTQATFVQAGKFSKP